MWSQGDVRTEKVPLKVSSDGKHSGIGSFREYKNSIKSSFFSRKLFIASSLVSPIPKHASLPNSLQKAENQVSLPKTSFLTIMS